MNEHGTAHRIGPLLVAFLALGAASARWGLSGTVPATPNSVLQSPPTEQALTQARALAASGARQVREQKRARLRARRQSAVRQVNQSAVARIQGLQAQTPPSGVPLSGPRLQPLTSEMRMMGRRPGPTPDPDAATISMVSPDPVAIGQTLAVAGNNFGTARGSVTLIAGDSYVIVTPSAWRPDRVEFTVPLTLGPVVGDRGHSVRVWVKKSGAALGPWQDVRVVPDPATQPPRITGVSPAEIQPEVIALIEGHGFGTARGTVRFLVTSSANPGVPLTLDGSVDAWSDALVAAHLPESMSGVGFGATAAIEVRNARGQAAEGRAGVRVVPALDTEVLTAFSWSFFGSGCRASYSSGPVVVRPALLNGWRVSAVETESHGVPSYPFDAGICGCQGGEASGSAGAYDVSATCRGTTGWVGCGCNLLVTLEGPRGLPWGTSSNS